MERVSDVDCANLSVECDVTAISDTKAWNSNTTQWVDSINVENGDVLTFNVTIFNQGNDDIWDDILQFIMPKCFEYEQNSASYPIDNNLS